MGHHWGETPKWRGRSSFRFGYFSLRSVSDRMFPRCLCLLQSQVSRMQVVWVVFVVLFLRCMCNVRNKHAIYNTEYFPCTNGLHKIISTNSCSRHVLHRTPQIHVRVFQIKKLSAWPVVWTLCAVVPFVISCVLKVHYETFVRAVRFLVLILLLVDSSDATI